MSRRSAGAWYRRAKETWYATVDGRKVSLGVRGRGNWRAAQEAWHRLMAGPPASARPRDPEARAVTAGELVAAFLADVRDRTRPKTVAVYRYLLDVFRAGFGGRPAATVRPHEVEASARRPSWSATTRHDYLAAVGMAFRWAVRRGFLEANPLADLRRPPKESRGAKVVLTADQYAALVEAAAPAFRVLLSGLWLTGCRPAELTRVEAKDVDLQAGVVVLTEHKTAGKTGRPRVIYLSPEALSLFRTQIEAHPTGPLFRNTRGGAWSGWAVVKAMQAARTKAGLPQAIAYGLRHSYATDALANGVPDATVAALLGHTSTAMLHRHYAHLTSQARVLRAAAALVRPSGSGNREPGIGTRLPTPDSRFPIPDSRSPRVAAEMTCDC